MKKIFKTLFLLLFIVVTITTINKFEVRAGDIDTNRYFYNQLNSEEKKYYNIFLDMAKKKQYKKTITFKGKSEKECAKLFEVYAKAKVTFEHDWPEYNYYFDLSGAYSRNYVITIELSWINPYELDKASDTIHKWAKSIDPDNKADRYTKVRRIWNIMTSNMEYNFDDNKSNMTSTHDTTTIGGTLYGKAICEGYMRIFKALCDEVGVPCLLVGNSSHGWNIVQMENDKWYTVDTTGQQPDTFPGLYGTSSDIYINGITNSANDKWYIGSLKYRFKWPKLATKDYMYSGKETDFSVKTTHSKLKRNGKFIYVKRDDGNYKLIKYYGEGKATIKVPSKYKGKPVVEIGSGAFSQIKGIKYIFIPKSVEWIGMEAFGEMPDLKKVTYRADGFQDFYVFRGNEKANNPYLSKLNAKNTKSGIKLTWPNVSKIENCMVSPKKYVIYRKAGNGKWKEIAKVKGKKCSYIDKNIKKGTKYTYAISIVVGNREGDYKYTTCSAKVK